MNKYQCLKCNKEFETAHDPKCPDCGANNYYSNNCKLIFNDIPKESRITGGFTWPARETFLEDICCTDKYED